MTTEEWKEIDWAKVGKNESDIPIPGGHQIRNRFALEPFGNLRNGTTEAKCAMVA